MPSTNIETQAYRPREIRVFLSSTFRDMDVERNHLVKEVFPKIRMVCAQRSIGFTEIDLRWGVTEQESKNGFTVQICLSEIDRCRDFPPFFIGFLGERYGWIPKEKDLADFWENHEDSEYADRIRQAISSGISVTELEMDMAVLEDGAAERLDGRVLFLLRDPSLTAKFHQADAESERDQNYGDATQKLNALKARIRKTPYLAADGYTSIQEFGQVIEDHLLQQLDVFFPQETASRRGMWARNAHTAFRKNRTRNFLPRRDILNQLRACILKRVEQPNLGPTMLTGAPGQGKSAILAALTEHLENDADGMVDWRVIDHYMGADGSTSLDDWLELVLQTVHPEIEGSVCDIPDSSTERQEVLGQWLSLAARSQEKRASETGKPRPVRFALIVDAPEQIPDGIRDLDLLLPKVVGPDAVVITSATIGTTVHVEALARGFEEVTVPPLGVKQRRDLVLQALGRYRKSLTEDLIDRLVQVDQADNPLFLVVATELLRLNARHETLPKVLDDILQCREASDLFLRRLLLDSSYGRTGQPDLAAQFMAFIGATRSGLAEYELAELLALPTDPISTETGRPRLPQVYLSRLAGVLQPNLIYKDGTRAPMHMIFAKAALQHVHEATVRKRLHTFFKRSYRQTFSAMEVRESTEALHQITCIAQADSTMVHKLKADLHPISVPAELVAEDTIVVRQALNTLGTEVVDNLAQKWARQIARAGPVWLLKQTEFARFLRNNGFHNAALCLLQQLFEEKQKEYQEAKEDYIHYGYGEDHIDTQWDEENFAIKNELSNVLMAMGDSVGARALQEELLTFDYDDTDLEELASRLVIMNNLAVTLAAQGKLADAVTALEQSIQKSSTAFGPQSELTIKLIINLSKFLRQMGELPTARERLENALEDSHYALGPEHLVTLNIRESLALVLNNLGDIVKSRAMLEGVMDAYQRLLGPTHPDVLKTHNNLAHMLLRQGEFGRAQAMSEQALEGMRKLFGPEHPETLEAMIQLGSFRQAAGSLEDARKLQEQALDASSRHLGSEHTVSLEARQQLSSTLYYMGEFEGARKHQDLLFKHHTENLGSEHPRTLTVLGNLAATLQAQGHHARARALKEELLECNRRRLGGTHPETLLSMGNLAVTLRGLAEFDSARKLEEQVLDENRRQFGSDHPDTLHAMNNLAETLYAQGDLIGARNFEETALTGRRKVLGPEHPQTLKTMGNHAQTLFALGDLASARSLQEAILVGRKRVLGNTHPETLVVMDQLSATLLGQGDAAGAKILQSQTKTLRRRQVAARKSPSSGSN